MQKLLFIMLLFCITALNYAGNTPPILSGNYCNKKNIVLLFNIPNIINVWSKDDKQLGRYTFSGLTSLKQQKFNLTAYATKGFPYDTMLGIYNAHRDSITIYASHFWQGIYHRC